LPGVIPTLDTFYLGQGIVDDERRKIHE